MALRFRKRLKVAPGLTFNLNWSKKNGVTTSSTVGVHGANVNIGTKKDGSIGVKRGTLGIPGSGLSNHENLDDSVKKKTITPLNSDHTDKVETSDEQEHYTLTDSDGTSSWLERFAYNRTLNWVINICILAGLFLLNR